VEISVLELLAFLAVPGGILVMSFLLPAAQPGSQPDDETPAATFDRVRPVFFGVLIGIVAINLAHELLISRQGVDADLVFQVAPTVLEILLVSLVLFDGGLNVASRTLLTDTRRNDCLKATLRINVQRQPFCARATNERVRKARP